MSVIELDLHESRFLLISLSSLAIGAALAIIISNLTWWIKCLLVLICIAQGGYSILRHALLRRSNSIRKIILLPNQLGKIYSVDKNAVYLRLQESWSSSLFTLLYFYKLNGKYSNSVIIFNDAVDKENYRQLLVYLKTQR